MKCIGIDFDSFSNVVMMTLERSGLSYRAAADKLGITHASFTRIKQKKKIDVDTFIILDHWIHEENLGCYFQFRLFEK